MKTIFYIMVMVVGAAALYFYLYPNEFYGLLNAAEGLIEAVAGVYLRK